MNTWIIDTCMHNPSIKTYAQQLSADHRLIVTAGLNGCEPNDGEVAERYNWFLREDAFRVSEHRAEIVIADATGETQQIEHILMSYQLTWINPNFSLLLVDENENRSAVLILAELPDELRAINAQHNIDLMQFIKAKYTGFVVPPFHHLTLAIEGGLILLSGILVSDGGCHE